MPATIRISYFDSFQRAISDAGSRPRILRPTAGSPSATMGLRSCLLAFLSVLALASSYSIAHRSAAVGSFAGVPRTVTAQPRRVAPRSGTISMGKVAKFGIFSPAVYAAKAASSLNNARGKTPQNVGNDCRNK